MPSDECGSVMEMDEVRAALLELEFWNGIGWRWTHVRDDGGLED
jgi:hypothetical protein